MSSGNTQATLRTAGLGLLAMAIGSTVAPPGKVTAQEQRISRVSCEVTSASSTNIASQDGFANALVNLAESVCGEGAQAVPIEERITDVASAMAEAVAEVIGTCTGQGNAVASVSGFSRAETRAEAVGRASARILTTSEVCGRCTAALETLAETVETVSATAVAEASISATFMFEEGEEQTMTASDVQRAVEMNIINVLSTVTGEVHTSAADGCSANAVTRAEVGDSFAECDVAISASDFATEIDAIANAGAAVKSIACDGEGNGAEVRLIVREVAVATAQAFVQADSFCESSGGPGTIACGMSNATITAVASAQANAFAEGLAEAMGPECDCDLSNSISASMMESIMAEATTSAMAQTCAGHGQSCHGAEGQDQATESDFQFATEEAIGVAVGEVIASALSGADCSVSVTVCAQSGECVERFEQCAGPGIDGMLACCDEDDVCASVLGSPAFRCENRAMVAAMPESATKTMECNP